MKKISIKKVVEQITIGVNDEQQNYVNCDYAGQGLKVFDYGVNFMEQALEGFYYDEDGNLYARDKEGIYFDVKGDALEYDD